MGLTHKLFRSTSIVASMTMLSRLLGFLRDVVLAQVFGASADFDAYIVAFKIPNFLRRLFAEGAFSQAFVPMLSELRAKESHETVQDFVNRIAGTLALVLSVVVAIAEIISPLIIMVFAPGFMHDPVRYHLATHLLRITFPYLFLISLSAFMGAILNTYSQFAVAAFTPTVLNIVLVLVAWFWAPYTAEPIYVLAWGTLMGGALQLWMQAPFLRKLNLLPRCKFGFTDPAVRRVMKLMVPALFGVSVAQLSLLVDNFFASFLPVGSISWLYYSDRLTFLPLGVIGVALATVVLPSLSRHHASQSKTAYSATLDWALRCALIIGMPCAFGLLLLSGPILATLLYRGAFTQNDVLMTTKSLMAFSAGLPAFIVVKILASGFYSRQNIKTPVKVAAIAMVVNLILNVCLISSLRHAGLALSTALASWINAFLLVILLVRNNIYQISSGWGKLLMRMGFALVAMGVFIYWLAGDVSQWLQWSVWVRSGHLCLIMAVAVLVYFVALMLAGMRLKDFSPPTES